MGYNESCSSKVTITDKMSSKMIIFIQAFNIYKLIKCQ